MKLDYLRCRKARLSLQEFAALPSWQLFISSYNDSDRVRDVFNAAPSAEKHWCLVGEYNYLPSEYPVGSPTFAIRANDESRLIEDYFEKVQIDFSARICVDITGFMRPQILFIVKYLYELGIRSFDVVYTEPLMYKDKEKTEFALGDVLAVRQVAGYEGSHLPDESHDLLVIGAGYDRELVSRVVLHKERARVSMLFGLPSLSADMYQQSVLQMWEPTDAIEGREHDSGVAYTSANDPFATATTLSEIWESARDSYEMKNLYLSPLGTKPQTLGFALFYLNELTQGSASVVFPFSRAYSRETSIGIGRIWHYIVEF